MSVPAAQALSAAQTRDYTGGRLGASRRDFDTPDRRCPDLLEVAQLLLVLDKTDVVSDKTYIEIMHDIAEKAELAVRRALGKD